ncbi:MAG TPA: hypothetical protein PKD68_00215 [Candidatus Saccharibacteria bacterium]|nr:hypothetical protein [Candidatus Saccharibacteria bacterium]
MVAFNHYAKIKRILAHEPEGWRIILINEPTASKNFKGELRHFDHYYRIVRANGEPIPYCKFQNIDRLAQILAVSIVELPIQSE